MDTLIKVENLNFVYNKGKDNEYQALININVEIYPKEYIIVFGPSGCGKSTLLNVIAGLETADDGKIFISGKEMTHMTRNEFIEYHRNGVGMIYQAYNLITSLTVLENVALPQLFLDVGKKDRDDKAMMLLERFGIKEHAKKIPTELSGGQQQRIGIARSIVNDPFLVLADEPIGNLDSVSAKNVLEILSELNEKEEKTIIMVTHNPENLNQGDRILYMKDGMIVREVINRKKGEKKPVENLTKPPSQEIENLLRAYQGLTPEQINILIMPYKAKLFTHHFITTRNMQETKSFEDIMQRKLMNTITQEEFVDVLNRSSDEGGVGFDKRTAEKIVRRINRAIRMAYYLYRKAHQHKTENGQHTIITLDEKAEKLTQYLLKTCYLKYYHHLSDEALLRIQQAVKDRLENNINRSEFHKIIDMPFKEGGVGLNVKTARAITEEIELVLILGFGISHTIHVPRPFDDEENTKVGADTASAKTAENNENAAETSAPDTDSGNADADSKDEQETVAEPETGASADAKTAPENEENSIEAVEGEDKAAQAVSDSEVAATAPKADTVVIGTDVWPGDDKDDEDDKAADKGEPIINLRE